MENNVFNIDGRIYNSHIPICPSCGVELTKFPGRKTKCKNCNAFYYSKISPFDQIHYIINEETNLEWEKVRYLYQTISSLTYFGITWDNDYDLSSRDILVLRKSVFSLLNKALNQKAGDFNVQSFLYGCMAKIAIDFGEDPTLYNDLSLKAQLYCLQFSGIQLNAQIISGGGSKCMNCKHLNGKVLSVEDAFNLKLIPHISCAIKYCNASYAGKRDDNDPTKDLDVRFVHNVSINKSINEDNAVSFDVSEESFTEYYDMRQTGSFITPARQVDKPKTKNFFIRIIERLLK